MTLSSLVGRLVRAGIDPEVANAYVRALEDGPQLLDASQVERLVDAGLAEEREQGPLNLFAPDHAFGQRAYQLESRARAMRQVGVELEAMFRQSWDEREPAVQFLHTTDAARSAYSAIQQAARQEVKALDRAPYVNEDGPTPDPAEFDALAAGVTYKVIYDANVLDGDDNRRHAFNAVTAGEQARVLGEVPLKMALVDEAIGLVARVLPEQQIECFLIRPSLLLDTLHSFFDTLWNLAIPIQPTLATDDTDEEVQMILRGLAAGLTDEAIGRELGVSERTVARRIARLQEMLATRSRFQLGMQAARRGLI